jgi:hypothetical protein
LPAVIVPVRALVVVFAAIVYATVPLPVPDAPLVIEIHAAFDAAVQAHVAADAVTANDPVPAASDTL